MLVPSVDIIGEYRDKLVTLKDEICLENIHFKNCYIEEQTAEYVIFRECILENVTFSDVHLKRLELSNVILKNCDLSNVNLEAPIFHRVKFQGCKLIGSYMPEGAMQYITFEECMCHYLNLGFTSLKEVAFKNCDLTESNFGECKMKKVSYEGTSLTRADFSQTSLGGIDLSTCEISGIKIQLAGLKNVKVNALQAIDFAKMLGVKVVE